MGIQKNPSNLVKMQILNQYFWSRTKYSAFLRAPKYPAAYAAGRQTTLWVQVQGDPKSPSPDLHHLNLHFAMHICGPQCYRLWDTILSTPWRLLRPIQDWKPVISSNHLTLQRRKCTFSKWRDLIISEHLNQDSGLLITVGITEDI